MESMGTKESYAVLRQAVVAYGTLQANSGKIASPVSMGAGSVATAWGDAAPPGNADQSSWTYDEAGWPMDEIVGTSKEAPMKA